MRYIVSIILLLASFNSLAMDDSASENLKHDSHTAKNYQNLIHNPSWSHFYEFVTAFTYLQRKENLAQKSDIKCHAKALSALIALCDDGFLGLNKQELQDLSEINTPQVLILRCNAIINRGVANLPREKLNILLLNALEEDNTPQDIPSAEETIVHQNPANNAHRRQCIVS